MSARALVVSAPGRICLFGEHQDYLGLPVIAAAIDRRIWISGQRREDARFEIDLPDIGAREHFSLPGPVPYERKRDYLRSGLNVLLRRGLRLERGYSCRVHGTIPINSGTSSSSALVVAWVLFLLAAAQDDRAADSMFVARCAHEAEVLEFHEPGGMMDHVTASFGGVLHIEFAPELRIESLPARLGKFVLGDSHEPKDTTDLLACVRGGSVAAMEALKSADAALSYRSVSLADIDRHERRLSREQSQLLRARVGVRDLTEQARLLLRQEEVDHGRLGALLTAHHRQLGEGLRISTPKIERMIAAALTAGALGAKINGSGGGGCMFAYAPERTEEVAQAITAAGGAPYVISVAQGAMVEECNL
ncbi:MAG: galactokinase family protein [bacterium]|jgi:galactokinase|nr:GHMP kinase [candidate division KSB1 bacterium]MDH7560993.1 galactokinase family protein [bacterium]